MNCTMEFRIQILEICSDPDPHLKITKLWIMVRFQSEKLWSGFLTGRIHIPSVQNSEYHSNIWNTFDSTVTCKVYTYTLVTLYIYIINILFRNFRRRDGCYTISGNLPRDKDINPRRSEEDRLSSASVPTLLSYISTSSSNTRGSSSTPAVTPTSPLEAGTTFGPAHPLSYTNYSFKPGLWASVVYLSGRFQSLSNIEREG